jgi:hypothetical protein
MRSLLAALACAASLALADIPPEEPEEPTAPAAVHPVGIEKAMPTGVIEGGWGYVIAAYAAGVLGVAGYAFSLFTRRPRQGATP